MPHQTSDIKSYGYQGKCSEKDQESGFNSFELRQWDSRLGRWMVPDPMGQYHNPYNGMGNNPVNRVDPTGGVDKMGALMKNAIMYWEMFERPHLWWELADIGYDDMYYCQQYVRQHTEGRMGGGSNGGDVGTNPTGQANTEGNSFGGGSDGNGAASEGTATGSGGTGETNSNVLTLDIQSGPKTVTGTDQYFKDGSYAGGTLVYYDVSVCVDNEEVMRCFLVGNNDFSGPTDYNYNHRLLNTLPDLMYELTWIKDKKNRNALLVDDRGTLPIKIHVGGKTNAFRGCWTFSTKVGVAKEGLYAAALGTNITIDNLFYLYNYYNCTGIILYTNGFTEH